MMNGLEINSTPQLTQTFCWKVFHSSKKRGTARCFEEADCQNVTNRHLSAATCSVDRKLKPSVMSESGIELSDLVKALNDFAPLNLAESWDNVVP